MTWGHSVEEGLLRDVHSPSHRDRPVLPVLGFLALFALEFGVVFGLGLSFPVAALVIVVTGIAGAFLWVYGMWASDRARFGRASLEQASERGEGLD